MKSGYDYSLPRVGGTERWWDWSGISGGGGHGGVFLDGSEFRLLGEEVVVMVEEWGWGSSEENGGVVGGGMVVGGEEEESDDEDVEDSSFGLLWPQVGASAALAAVSAQEHGMTVEE